MVLHLAFEIGRPSKLVDMYDEIYQEAAHGFVNDHMKLDDVGDSSNGITDESMKRLEERLSIVIFYGELLLTRCFESTEPTEALGNCALGGNFSSLVLGDMHDACSLLDPLEKKIEFWMRSHWLEALIFL
ncbi:hypothetical protein V9T40_007900 [Parthenolecanium corni]|uniref:Uncharacterized protein n=1 Tax=Parthenolecanium corni TaxID=536013 RepID=A0AAN9TSY0_9HEMI